MTCTACEDERDPFSHLQLASFLPLEMLKGRSKCSGCGASRKYFCYTCCLPVDELMNKIPVVEIPVQIDVIKHPLENDGKSTAVHAALLAPKQVQIYTYPCIPEYKDPNKVLLVFPSENAKTLANLLTEASNLNGEPESVSGQELPPPTKKLKRDPKAATSFETVIFIDSTWSQSKKIFNDERLKDLPCVVLDERKTYFWRTQDKEESFLATIEAIYYFLVDLFKLTSDLDYSGQYDNLMYFFVFMFRMVRKRKKSDKQVDVKEKTVSQEAGVG